jgi:hypothetical protein
MKFSEYCHEEQNGLKIEQMKKHFLYLLSKETMKVLKVRETKEFFVSLILRGDQSKELSVFFSSSFNLISR